MSNAAIIKPYVYQPYDMRYPVYWDQQRIYGVAGVGDGLAIAKIQGLTKDEAERVCAALTNAAQFCAACNADDPPHAPGCRATNRDGAE